MSRLATVVLLPQVHLVQYGGGLAPHRSGFATSRCGHPPQQRGVFSCNASASSIMLFPT